MGRRREEGNEEEELWEFLLMWAEAIKIWVHPHTRSVHLYKGAGAAVVWYGMVWYGMVWYGMFNIKGFACFYAVFIQPYI